MDTTITTLEFCTGYGGIGLGLKNIFGERMRTIAYCELEGFAQANLLSKMEKGLMDVAPLWNDLKTFPYESFHGLVDILIAGYPCQPFSSAGKRAGKEDPRHLWPWIADGIRLLQPRMCFFENVEGHISLGLREVIGDLEELGYKSSFGIFSAAEVGAPHQRKRVFILAYDQSQRIQGHGADWLQESRPHAGQGLPLRGGDAGCGELADDTGERLSLSYGQRNEPEGQRDAEFECCGHNAWPSRPGQPQHGWEPPRVVGNSTSKRSCGGSKDGANKQPEMLGTGHEAVGNCDSLNRSASPEGWEHDSEAGSASERQAQSALGGDADGPADWMDYAELQVSCDNRTDELRLLGNGVVPATAERAFRTLLNELNA